MKRREILKYTAYVTGAAISAPLISSLLSGCASEAHNNVAKKVLQFFSEEEISLVKSLVDTIIPQSEQDNKEVPSAAALNIHHTIDEMVGTVYKSEDRTEYRTGFNTLKTYISSAIDGFENANREERESLLVDLELSDDVNLKPMKEAFKDLKQQTIAYYLSTEQIMKEHLNYLPIPGEYEPCITLESVGGKKWAI